MTNFNPIEALQNNYCRVCNGAGTIIGAGNFRVKCTFCDGEGVLHPDIDIPVVEKIKKRRSRKSFNENEDM